MAEQRGTFEKQKTKTQQIFNSANEVLRNIRWIAKQLDSDHSDYA